MFVGWFVLIFEGCEGVVFFRRKVWMITQSQKQSQPPTHILPLKSPRSSTIVIDIIDDPQPMADSKRVHMRWDDKTCSWFSVDDGTEVPVQRLTIPTTEQHAEQEEAWKRTTQLADKLRVESDAVLFRNHITEQMDRMKCDTFSVKYPRNIYAAAAIHRIEEELKSRGWRLLNETVTNIVKWELTRKACV